MIIIDNRNINSLKGTDSVKLKCNQCSELFLKKASEIRHVLKHPNNGKNTLKCCSISCSRIYKNKLADIYINCKCDWCHIEIVKSKSEFNGSEKHFCSKSCSAKYGNTFRRYGLGIRSKCEIYIEDKIKKEFPKQKIIFNSREILNGLELDLYMPNLNLAFEINGIGHYLPIFGKEELKKKLNKDKIKKRICKKLGIKLKIIKLGRNKSESYLEKKYIEIKNKIRGCIESTGN